MKKLLFYVTISTSLFSNCVKTGISDGFLVCGTGCSAPNPWTVETLDTGLPCFPSQDSCYRWAAAHGYGNKPCVMCN